jgi:hypothetical protein
MLTGDILFVGGNWMEMFEKKRRLQPTDQWPEVDASDELRTIIRGALQPNERDRRLDLEKISRWAEKVEGLFGEPETETNESDRGPESAVAGSQSRFQQ